MTSCMFLSLTSPSLIIVEFIFAVLLKIDNFANVIIFRDVPIEKRHIDSADRIVAMHSDTMS